MKWILLLFLTACATPRQTVSLPTFPEVGVEYEYLIKVPISSTQATIYWYLGAETREQMLYNSGLVNLKTSTIRTEMIFPVPGRYLLVVYAQTPDGVIKQRHIYNARAKFSQ
jgi:hypothetical protein